VTTLISNLEQFIDDVYDREQIRDPKLLDSYAFNRIYYPQTKQKQIPPKHVERASEGNTAGERGPVGK